MSADILVHLYTILRNNLNSLLFNYLKEKITKSDSLLSSYGCYLIGKDSDQATSLVARATTPGFISDFAPFRSVVALLRTSCITPQRIQYKITYDEAVRLKLTNQSIVSKHFQKSYF